MANQIKIPATASNRAAQKMTIPWDDGSGNNLYLNFDPEFVGTQDVVITSDENPKDEARTKNLVFKTSTPGLSSGQQSQATLEIVQTPSVITYKLELQDVTGVGSISSGNKFQVIIPASGGEGSLVFRLAKYINNKFDSYIQENITSGITHYDPPKFNWIELGLGNSFTVDNRGTTEGDIRLTSIISYTYHNGDKENPISASTFVSFAQEANVKTLTAISIQDEGTLNDVPASGDTSYDPTKYWTGAIIAGSYSYTSGLMNTETGGLNTDEWRLIYTQAPPTSIASLGATPKARSLVDNFEWRVQAIENTSIQSERLTMEIYQEANSIDSITEFEIHPNLYRIPVVIKNSSGVTQNNTYFEASKDPEGNYNIKAMIPAGGGTANWALVDTEYPLDGTRVSGALVFTLNKYSMTSGTLVTTPLTNLDLDNNSAYNAVGVFKGNRQGSMVTSWSKSNRGTTPGDESVVQNSFKAGELQFYTRDTIKNIVSTNPSLNYTIVQEANYIIDMPNINLTNFIDSSYILPGSAAGGSIYINDNPFNGLGIPSGSTFTSGSKTTSATYVDMIGIWEAIGKYGVKLIAEFTAAQAPYTFADGSTDEFDLTEAFKDKPYNSSVEFIKGFQNLGTTVTQVSNVTAIRFRMEATDTHSGTSTEFTSTSYAVQQAANNKFADKIVMVLEGTGMNSFRITSLEDLQETVASDDFNAAISQLDYRVPSGNNELYVYFDAWQCDLYSSGAIDNAAHMDINPYQGFLVNDTDIVGSSYGTSHLDLYYGGDQGTSSGASGLIDISCWIYRPITDWNYLTLNLSTPDGSKTGRLRLVKG